MATARQPRDDERPELRALPDGRKRVESPQIEREPIDEVVARVLKRVAARKLAERNP